MYNKKQFIRVIQELESCDNSLMWKTSKVNIYQCAIEESHN